MKQIRERTAGLDVHRDLVVACTRVPGESGVVVAKRRFATTPGGVAVLADWLTAAGVTTVVMEATGVYWKAVFYPLEGRFEELWLVNAAHVKNVPGRKTDMIDAEWLADVAAHGMVRPSFVPPPPIRELRELTRYRTTQIDARADEIRRLEKVLQDAGVKLTSVASRVWTMSGRAMVEALIAGERDPGALAELAKGKLRARRAELAEVMPASWSAHHAAVARQILSHIDFLDASITTLTEEIAARIDAGAFDETLDLAVTAPGVARRATEILIAETGADLTVFATAAQFCSWIGVAPGTKESAGKRKPAKSMPGNRHLRRILIEAARAAARTDTFLGARYRRIARHAGPNKAAVAVARSLATALYYMLTTHQPYHDLGPDFYDRPAHKEHILRDHVRHIEAMGYSVVLSATT